MGYNFDSNCSSTKSWSTGHESPAADARFKYSPTAPCEIFKRRRSLFVTETARVVQSQNFPYHSHGHPPIWHRHLNLLVTNGKLLLPVGMPSVNYPACICSSYAVGVMALLRFLPTFGRKHRPFWTGKFAHFRPERPPTLVRNTQTDVNSTKNCKSTFTSGS